MLHATAAPALLDLAVATLQAPAAAAATAALLLLRNLSFHPAIRSPILSNKQLLPILLAAAECLLPRKVLQSESAVQSSVSSSQGKQQQQQWVVPYGKPSVLGLPAASRLHGNMNSGGRPDTAGGSRNPPAAAGAAADGRGADLRGSRGGSLILGTAAAEGKEAGPGRCDLAGTAVGRVVGAAGNVCAAVYATSALWALVYQGEALKAAVRKLPDGMSRLVAVQAHAAWLRGGASAEGEGGGAAVVLRQLSCVAACPVGSGDVVRWLEELEVNCEVVLQLMHSNW